MKLFLGAPTHYQAEPSFVQSLLALCTALPREGIRVQVSMPSQDSLVQRVRNHVARDFMSSDSTHLLFIDADIAFGVDDVKLLINSGFPLVGAAYPLKRIDWEQVHAAAVSGVPADELHAHAASFVVVPETEAAVDNGCLPVRYLGTGFLLIAREVFEAVAKLEPDNHYVSGMPSDKGALTHAFFDCPVVDHNLLSEDWSFSRKAKLAGYTPMLHLGCVLAHIGSHAFRGDLRTQFTERVA